MNALESALDAVLAAPLAEARAAGTALGYLGDVPLDVLLATGRVVAHLPWRADRATPLANQWLEGSFPGLARSVLEDWARGEFDAFGQVVFSRADDSSQRLYYYICELQRRGLLAGPEPLIFDVARIPRESSLRHTQAAVGKLAEALGLDPAMLVRGIERTNAQRELLGQAAAQPGFAGTLLAKFGQASLFTDLSALAAQHAPPRALPGPRLLLAGSAPPDARLHEAIAAAGWQVAAELHERCLARLGPRVTLEREDPAHAIGRHCHGAPLGPRGFGDAAAALLARARSAAVAAVVVWLTREEEALAWHVPAQRQALAAAGIPALFLTARRWDASDGAGAEIQRFLKECAR